MVKCTKLVQLCWQVSYKLSWDRSLSTTLCDRSWNTKPLHAGRKKERQKMKIKTVHSRECIKNEIKNKSHICEPNSSYLVSEFLL